MLCHFNKYLNVREIQLVKEGEAQSVALCSTALVVAV